MNGVIGSYWVRWNPKIIKCLMIGLIILFTADESRGQDWRYTGSMRIAGGDYIFTDATLSLYLYNGLSVAGGPFHFSANVPIIMQTTAWVSYSGVGMLPTGGRHHVEVGQRSHGEIMELPELSEPHEVGLGDPTSRLEMDVRKEKGSLPSVQFLAEVKFPVADVDRGFGTGEWDYGGGFSLAKTARNRSYHLELLYWSLGDLPELELKDPVAFSLSVGQPLGGGAFDMLVSLSGCTRIIKNVEHPAQFGVALLRRMGPGRTISFGADLGLTESAPAFQVSMGWIIGQ